MARKQTACAQIALEGRLDVLQTGHVVGMRLLSFIAQCKTVILATGKRAIPPTRIGRETRVYCAQFIIFCKK